MRGDRWKWKKKTVVAAALTAVLLAVFFVSAGMAVSEFVRGRREERAFEDLADKVQGRPTSPTPASSPATQAPSTQPSETGPAATEPPETEPPETVPATAPEIHIPTPEELYGPLAELNPDLFGWVRIQGTQVDYPVMHTPEDPEYYLRRAFDKSNATSGTPFMDGACFEGCGNYIVYGHKMSNGTMFADILRYERRSYWREHPVIQFDTLHEFGDYEVVAAFYSRVYNELDGDEVFRYYRYTDLTDEAVFNEFIEKAKASSLYDTGVDAAFGDQLLTLSTCSYHVDDGRFVVIARKIPAKGSTPTE